MTHKLINVISVKESLVKGSLTTYSNRPLKMRGWIRTIRSYPEFSFVNLNDGSCLANIQLVVDQNLSEYDEILKCNTGASLEVAGQLVESKGEGQTVEFKVTHFKVFHPSDPQFPVQKKGIKFETLREMPHLRSRTNTFGAVFRTRSFLAQSLHRFFSQKGFFYIHTPIITSSDCEGAGELFRVTTLDLAKVPTREKGGVREVQYKKDFFGRPTFLTVSGQLAVEAFCCSLGNVYTFGPTFRSENSNTARHAAEFWMIEPELAFAELFENMDCAEEMIRFLISDLLQNCSEDLEFFNDKIQKGLIERLHQLIGKPFARIPYKEAVEILQKSGQKFEFKVEFGTDLQTEHERFLVENHFKGPVFVYNYPKSIKAFYMYGNEDNETVRAMDLLVPGVGELIGGSQREHRIDPLLNRLQECHLDPMEYQWYLDFRRYGTIPHSGFGLGFERMLMLVTGMQNIRDVIPYPRTPGLALC